jgi:hypothetical protein
MGILNSRKWKKCPFYGEKCLVGFTPRVVLKSIKSFIRSSLCDFVSDKMDKKYFVYIETTYSNRYSFVACS